jgi:quinol monooxygenase YgiN
MARPMIAIHNRNSKLFSRSISARSMSALHVLQRSDRRWSYLAPVLGRYDSKRNCRGYRQDRWKEWNVSQVAGYVVVDIWRAKPGMRDDVDRILIEAADKFRRSEGIVSVDYARLEDQSDMYLVVFRYADRAAREAFVETDELRSTMTALRQVWDLESPIFRGQSFV